MKGTIALLALVVIGTIYLATTSEQIDSISATPEVQFKDFIQSFKRNYESKDEYTFRFNIFKKTLKEIKELNSNPNDEAEYAINDFADFTTEEYTKLLGGKVPENQERHVEYTMLDETTVKESFDWRNYEGKVHPVKSQGSCGSCWAFATIAGLESAWAITHGDLLTLSEQELVDCSRSYGCQGCDGGW
jgi:C1A family cysteine protease